jgi:hypothetical protein
LQTFKRPHYPAVAIFVYVGLRRILPVLTVACERLLAASGFPFQGKDSQHVSCFKGAGCCQSLPLQREGAGWGAVTNSTNSHVSSHKNALKITPPDCPAPNSRESPFHANLPRHSPNRQERRLSSKPALRAENAFPIAAVLALSLAGFVLRLFCARGDLWLDEIWSLQNLEPLHRADEILYAISQDNNHFLNSFWLFIVGPNAPPQIIRLEAILCGTLTIPAAAKLASHAGRAAALAAAALVTFGLIFVHYGSEARGYAGFLLMLFIAAEALENFLVDPRKTRYCAGFAVAVGFGALFHIAMIEAAGVLVAATLARIAFRTRSATATGKAARDLGVSVVLGALPALACIAAGILYTHKIQFGVQVPFSYGGMVEGLAALFGATLGFTFASSAFFALPAALLWTSLALLIVAVERRILPAFAIFLPPLLAVLAHLPNVHIPRFHLIATLGLVLLFAEVVGHFWRCGRPGFALAIVFVPLASNAVAVADLLAHGRGDYRSLIARMEADGAATYASNMQAEIIRTIRFYDKDLGGRLAPAAEADWCGVPPRWYILSDDPEGEAKIRSFGPLQCALPFAREEVMIPASLSGLRLALYRRFGP